MVNGNEVKIPPNEFGAATQTVKCGAAIRITQEVMEHGIAFIHEDLPLFKLFFAVSPEGGKLNHRFEICKPIIPEVKKFVVEVVPSVDLPPLTDVADPSDKPVDAPKSSLILPEVL